MGTANIYGGTFTGGVSRTSIGVLNLYGGSFSGVNADGVSVATYGKGTLYDLKADEHAYFQNDLPITEGLNENELTGTITVKECNHTGNGIWGYAQLDDDQHQYACLACWYTSGEPEYCTPDVEYACDNNNHWNECTVCKCKCNETKHNFSEWAADNTRVCIDCGYKQYAVAQLEIDGDTTCYSSIKEALEAADGKTTVVTLLSDVTTDETLWVTGGNITFNGGSHTLTSTANRGAFLVEDGKLTITGGTIKATYVGVYIVGGTVSITSGTFTCSMNTIYFYGGKISELLGVGYAYYQEGGNPVTSGLESDNLCGGTYTVKGCDHSEVVYTDNENGTHNISCCPACGYTGTVVCTYGEEYQHNEINHWQTCKFCGYEKVEKHSFTKYVSNGDATSTKDGTKTAKCDRCDETNTITDKGSMIITTVATTVTTSTTTVTTKATSKVTTKSTTKSTITTKATTVTTKATNKVTTKATTKTTPITTTVTTTTSKNEIPGDINGDGKTTVSDLVIMQRYLVKDKKITVKQWKPADMNSDGKVNVFDVIILKRKLLK